MKFLGFLQQNTSVNSFIYCKVEQGLWCEKSEEHPSDLEEKAMGGSVTSGRYVKVQCTPHAYDHGAEAERENTKCGSLCGFSDPQIRRIAWSGSVGWEDLHLVYGQVI